MKRFLATHGKGMRLLTAGALAFVSAFLACAAHADTVASLLGNFTINQYCGLQLSDGSIQVRYAVVFGQVPALLELHAADANGDGVTSQSERDEYVRRLAPEFARQLIVAVDGVPVPLHLTRSTSSLPTEQGGFSLRLDAEFSGALPSAAAEGTHRLTFANQNYAGRIGWREISVQSIPSVRVFDTDAYATSLTGGLTEALQTLPATGPLDETNLHMSFTKGPLPIGAQAIRPRDGTPISASQAPQPELVASGETAWLQIQTKRLVDLISTPTVAPHVAILALLIALVLGALHALSPGHGKTLVGAYLIGSRGTARHAVFLGLTVTITHTLGVFALGFATLFASRFIVPEKLFPILSLVSGLLVLGMGMVLLAQRWRGARAALAGRRYEVNREVTPAIFAPQAHRTQMQAFAGQGHGYIHAAGHAQAHFHQGHDRHHDHVHGHEHEHSHGNGHTHDDGHSGSLTHSHGGSVHSHLPPGTDGEKVTWRSLLALGISGGLIPCPSAMVLLLAAVALNKTVYGMLLVLAFSVGLAITLTVIGLAFLYARNRMGVSRSTARWPHLLPVLSAALITLVGAALCFNALQTAHL
jgi:nickel/cobalt transporter (NicO) family protein